MADLAVAASGASPVFVAASAGGDRFKNSAGTELLILNNSASAVILTITARSRCKFKFLDDGTFTIPAMQLETIRPFASERYNDAQQMVDILFDSVTSITIAAKRLPAC